MSQGSIFSSKSTNNVPGLFCDMFHLGSQLARSRRARTREQYAAALDNTRASELRSSSRAVGRCPSLDRRADPRLYPLAVRRDPRATRPLNAPIATVFRTRHVSGRQASQRGGGDARILGSEQVMFRLVFRFVDRHL
jgi:hypothetical protein